MATDPWTSAEAAPSKQPQQLLLDTLAAAQAASQEAVQQHQREGSYAPPSCESRAGLLGGGAPCGQARVQVHGTQTLWRCTTERRRRQDGQGEAGFMRSLAPSLTGLVRLISRSTPRHWWRPKHSVEQEWDYVCPRFALFLGLHADHQHRCNRIGVRVGDCDPRLSLQDADELQERSAILIPAASDTCEGTGALKRMDNLLLVEPCPSQLSGGSAEDRIDVSLCAPSRAASAEAVSVSLSRQPRAILKAAGSQGNTVYSVHSPCAHKGVLPGPPCFRRKAKQLRTVKFGWAVDFWFPSPEQLTLQPRARTSRSCTAPSMCGVELNPSAQARYYPLCPSSAIPRSVPFPAAPSTCEVEPATDSVACCTSVMPCLDSGLLPFAQSLPGSHPFAAPLMRRVEHRSLLPDSRGIASHAPSLGEVEHNPVHQPSFAQADSSTAPGHVCSIVHTFAATLMSRVEQSPAPGIMHCRNSHAPSPSEVEHSSFHCHPPSFPHSSQAQEIHAPLNSAAPLMGRVEPVSGDHQTRNSYLCTGQRQLPSTPVTHVAPSAKPGKSHTPLGKRPRSPESTRAEAHEATETSDSPLSVGFKKRSLDGTAFTAPLHSDEAVPLEERTNPRKTVPTTGPPSSDFVDRVWPRDALCHSSGTQDVLRAEPPCFDLDPSPDFQPQPATATSEPPS